MTAAQLPLHGRVLQLLFALLLLTTGFAKLADMGGFIAVVSTYRVLPELLVAPSAWILAATEAGLALWLMSGRRLQRAARATVLLHAIYLGWVGLALARGLEIANCGCFGVYLARPLRPSTLFEDAILLASALILWRASRRTAARSVRCAHE